jgi:hypothetical protein
MNKSAGKELIAIKIEMYALETFLSDHLLIISNINFSSLSADLDQFGGVS